MDVCCEIEQLVKFGLILKMVLNILKVSYFIIFIKNVIQSVFYLIELGLYF